MSQAEKVIQYYQGTQRDYKWFWMSSNSLAMHFGYYDETVRTHDSSLLKMNEVLARYAQITSHDHILDAGCGFGGSTIWLARMFGCQVKGINIVPEQVEEAQHFARHHQVSDLTQFARMDFTRTTYADASFDVVWGSKAPSIPITKARLFRRLTAYCAREAVCCCVSTCYARALRFHQRNIRSSRPG